MTHSPDAIEKLRGTYRDLCEKCQARQIGHDMVGFCPVHDDSDPSLLITLAEADGKILLHCRAGCDTKKACYAFGISASRLSIGKPSRPVPRITGQWVYTDELGAPLYRSVRTESGEINTRKCKPQKKFFQERWDGSEWRRGTKGVRQVPYRLFDLIFSAGPILIAEGERKADRLAELGFTATCNVGGAGGWKAEFGPTFTGRDVVILPDADKPGRNHAKDVAEKLKSHAKSVRILELPGLPEAGDVLDWLAAGGTAEQFLELLEKAVPANEWASAAGTKNTCGKPPDDPRIPVEVTADEHIVIEQSIAALAASPIPFKRAGRLTHIVREIVDADEDGISRAMGTPRIRDIQSGYLRELLASSAYYFKQKDTGEEVVEYQCSPPGWAVNSVYSRGFWPPVRHLSGITEIPTLRSDGTILDSPGWDESTGLIFEPSGEFPAIPPEPTRDEVEQAGTDLIEIVEDFPFGTPAHRSAWVAGLLTILGRRAFEGPAPMFVIDANTRGSGKSMLTDIVSIVVTGRKMPRMTAPTDDDEFRKRVTAIALNGDPIILVDNVAGALGGPSIDAAMTSTTWKDRRLGVSEVVEMPLKAVWFATGNNMALRGDLSRRVVHVRLESPLENPEERDDFRHPNLLAHVRNNRSKLVAAGLTMLRAYFVAGRPSQQLKSWGSFEGWSDLIRDCLVWVGFPDPGESRSELVESSDRDAVALRTLLESWHEIDPHGHGVTSSELAGLLDSRARRRDLIDGDMPVSAAEMLVGQEAIETRTVHSAIAELCGLGEVTRRDAHKIGNRLRQFRGRTVSGRRLDYREGHARERRWIVIQG
ncbi:hypothetical protein [Planctomicrobium sp. SH664]|uniref:hypothetical protein n=1 Tax=Planctomicrobium sp. SH664 TaxID=3448125 RepID=UPI003F5AF022